MEFDHIEYVVVITTIQPILLAWVAAIGFFVSLSLTAMISPGRRWFELVVIFGLLFAICFSASLLTAQFIGGISIIELDFLEKASTDLRLLR